MKILSKFLTSLVSATCLTHLVLHDYIVVVYLVMLDGSLVTTAWRVLRYGGKLRIY
jgi:hypothetical protein